MIVEAWLVRAARMNPDRIAVGELSYAELAGRAQALAATLPRGERIGIALPAGEAAAIALHAVWLVGGVAVPLPQAQDRCVHVIDAVGDESAPLDPGATHDLDSPAVVIRTSGTTAEPHEVELTYGNWLWSALGSAAALGVDQDERWLCPMPLTHVGGLSVLTRSVVYGTTVIVHERFDIERVREELMDPGGPTIVSMVPTMLRRLLDAGLTGPPVLRTVLLGGAPIPAQLIADAEAAGVPVTPTYGLTEACSQVVVDGRPLFCTDVRLAEDGEVLVSGPTVAPAAGSVLATGDIGAWDEDGRLRITGRKLDTIITGGENVAPVAVEEVLEQHPAVIEAAVLGVADAEWGEAVVALVRCGAPVDDRELADWCRERLLPPARPKRFVQVTEPLPRTPTGKLMRRSINLDDI